MISIQSVTNTWRQRELFIEATGGKSRGVFSHFLHPGWFVSQEVTRMFSPSLFHTWRPADICNGRAVWQHTGKKQKTQQWLQATQFITNSRFNRLTNSSSWKGVIRYHVSQISTHKFRDFLQTLHSRISTWGDSSVYNGIWDHSDLPAWFGGDPLAMLQCTEPHKDT